MEFNLREGRAVLERTPGVLRAMLADLPEAWVRANNGPDTWSPFDVVGHLIDGERDDWIPRAQIILTHGDRVAFTPFDRTSHLRRNTQASVAELLDAFAAARSASLSALDGMRLTEAQLALKGLHPELGSVTLGQLLSTWVAHDLGHIEQIARTMARQYRAAVGPWTAYLGVMR